MGVGIISLESNPIPSPVIFQIADHKGCFSAYLDIGALRGDHQRGADGEKNLPPHGARKKSTNPPKTRNSQHVNRYGNQELFIYFIFVYFFISVHTITKKSGNCRLGGLWGGTWMTWGPIGMRQVLS